MKSNSELYDTAYIEAKKTPDLQTSDFISHTIGTLEETVSVINELIQQDSKKILSIRKVNGSNEGESVELIDLEGQYMDELEDAKKRKDFQLAYALTLSRSIDYGRFFLI